MSYGYIYKIQFPNGKHYIGLTTTSIEQRTKEHRYSAKCGNTQCIYKALRKHAMVDTFELIEIDTAETLEELSEKEIAYIQMYNSYYKDDCGYNMTFGGEGFNGYVYTEDVKQKISEARKKHFIENPNAGKDQGERMKEYYEKNPEERLKMSERSKRQFESPESRQKNGERIKEYYEKNPEARQKNRQAQKNRSPEWKIKHSDTKGKNKPFDIFTIDGTFVKTFCYQFEAKQYLQQEYHIEKTLKIDEVLAGKRNNSAGFIFTYK